jgi:predicted nuclease of predicted toxin-antitoxin system
MFKLTPKYVDELKLMHANDIERIIQLCKTNGCLISADDAYIIWSQYSEDVSPGVGWLGFDNDLTDFVTILEYSDLHEIEEEST